ncbi:MAG: PAS domain S-box protein [Bacteroidales bacterium]|nr:PAS domain S-box protein [Bacteroidales bacterium]
MKSGSKENYNKLTRKELIERVKELEKLRSVYEHSADIIWNMDQNLVFTQVSPAVRKILNYEAHEVIGQHFHKFFTNDSVGKAKKNIAEKMQNEDGTTASYHEYEMLDKDNQIVHVEVTSEPVYDHENNLTGFTGIARDISARKHAKELLDTSRQRLQMAIERTGIGLWEQDFQKNNVYRSENWFKMLGYKPAEFSGRLETWLDLVHVDDIGSVQKAIRDHETGKTKLFRAEHRMKTREGDWKWILNWGKITERDKNGKPRKAVGVHIDIDELKNAEEEIQRIELERSRILNSLDDLFVYYDLDMRIKMLNKAAEKYLGKLAKDCIGKVCYEFWRNGQLDFCDECHVMRTMKSRRSEVKTSKVGEKYYRFKAVPVTNDKKELIGVAEFGQDITSMKEAEFALKESEGKYRKLTETTRDIICIHNLQGRIKYLNQAGLNMIGLSSKEAMEKNVMDFISKKYHEQLVARQKKRMANDSSIFLYETEFLTKKGKKIPVEISSTVLEKVESGYDILITARDITERKRAEKKLKAYSSELEKTVSQRTRQLEKQKSEMERSQKALTYLLEDVNESWEEMEMVNRKLEDANKELEAFSYSVSHDLKAPLRALDGFSQILLEDYQSELDDSGIRYLNLIRENSQRMGALIQDLLDFSRVGRYRVSIQDINMKLMVEELIRELPDDKHKNRTDFMIHELPHVFSDKSMIRQVFQNLLSNAVKFSRHADKPVVEIGSNEGEDHLEFFVKDNGVGFDMKYKHKLFKVFQRLHTQEEFEGTGVGLAIIKRIMKRLGGDVDVKSELGKGACFSFVLPKK